MNLLLLELEGLTSGYYEDIEIIKNISLIVKEKSIVSIIGPNGAGKSTILKTIYGFLKPKNGKIKYKEKDITGSSPYELKRIGISYVPQSRSNYQSLTVHENLMMACWIIRKNNKTVSENIERVYEIFPVLREFKDIKSTFLSGGQLRMLEIGKGLVTDPELLILDEPSVGLQPSISDNIYRCIYERKEKGTSILFVDQNIRDAVRISNYIYLIEMGKVSLEGTKDFISTNLKKIIKSSIYLP